MSKPAGTAPSPDQIRAQVERMIASDEFSRSPQLGAFLRFVVEAVLDGKADRIKAYTIGVEVLRRDTKFDPQIDPIVRVEATRLRRTIDRYYAGPGGDDPVRIELPRGSYAPTFRRGGVVSGIAPPRPAKSSMLDLLPSLRPLLAALASIFVIAIVAAIMHHREPAPETAANGSPNASRSAPEVAPRPTGNGLPVLFMPQFETSGTPGPHSISARSLHDTLSGAFTHFDLINVLLESKERPASADPRAEYRFAGSIEYSDDGAARLLFRLIDVGDGSIVWSRVFDRVPPSDDQSSAEEKVVRGLAGILLQPYGVIYAHQRAKVLAGTLVDPRYRCLVEVIDSFSSFDATQQARGRECLEQLTARNPSFALGFTYLAALDLREYEYGTGVRDVDAPSLKRGLDVARRGVELSPESSRAYEMLFVILFARGEMTAAFDAAARSIALNRYDVRVLGAYGSRLIARGDTEKGLAALQQAGNDGTVRPPYEEFFLFLGAYLQGNMSDAIFHAGQITGDSFQLGLIARSLAAAAKGEREAAGRALGQLVTLNPSWRDDTRGSLAKFFPAQAIVDRLAADLAAAGLPARS